MFCLPNLRVDDANSRSTEGTLMAIAWLALVAVTLAGCGTTYVADPKKARGASDTSTSSQVLQEPVYFELNPTLADTTPDCIHVLPFDDPKQLDTPQHFRKAFHAQLSVTGVRLIPLQAIEKTPAAQIAKSQNCPFEFRGEVTENSRLFLGIYSEYKAGATVTLVHLPTGQAFWTGSHSMVKRSGGIPIGIISSIAGAASAAKNLESDQSVRVSYELAYRMVKSIPNLRYFEPQDAALALATPGETPPSSPQTTPPGAETPIVAPPTDQERLQAALDKRDHAAVISVIESIQSKTGKESPAHHILLGHAYQGLGQHEKATSGFITAIALGESTDASFVALGKSYAALGRFDFAAAAFDKAVALNDRNLDALMLGGVAHSANGDDDAAYAQLRKALVTSLAATDQASARRAINAFYSTGLFDRLPPKDQQFLQSQQ